jgi:hypothetical protein
MDLPQIALPLIDSTIISAIIVGIPTTILTIITYFYMTETRKIRKGSQEPNFSIAPTTFVLGGTFYRLLLLNSGQTAKSIYVDCSWKKSTANTTTSKNFYIISLSSTSRSILDEVPIAEIIQNKDMLTIKIKCKDSKNEDFEDKLIIDFDELTKENRVIAFQSDSDERVIRAIEKIESKLGDIVRKLKS